MEELRQHYEAMKYQNLRQEAKKHGVKANLKKSDMIDQLVEMLEKQHVSSGLLGKDKSHDDANVVDAEKNCFHASKSLNDNEEGCDGNAVNLSETEEKLNRTFEIHDSEHSELLKVLGDVTKPQGHYSGEKDGFKLSETEAAIQSPIIRPRKRPETIAKHFATLHDKLSSTNETLNTFMERKRARHASLTRGVSLRMTELAKPKVAQAANFLVEDIEKLNLNFSSTLITPKCDKVRRSSSHNALNRSKLQTSLNCSIKNNSRSVDLLRLEILAKPKRFIYNSPLKIESTYSEPKKTPILTSRKIKRSNSLGAAVRVTQVTQPVLDFESTPEPDVATVSAVSNLSRIEQLSKPKSVVSTLTLPKGTKLQRSRSYKAYAKPYKYTDTTKMSDVQYREYLATQNKKSS